MAKKRGNSEGSIFKRKDGRWASVITLGWEGGKRKRKAFYGKTRHDVQVLLNQALNNQQKGVPIPPERQTVGSFLEYWLEESAKPGVRPRTFQSYSELVNVHLIPGLGRIPLTKLTQQHIQQLINAKLSDGLSPRRVQYMHAVLRRALGQAEKWDLVSRNVAKLVDPPRVVQAEIRPFTPDESRMFLTAIRGERLEALYVLAISTGLRQGELLGLSWSDVDLAGRELTVRTTLQRIRGDIFFLEPKTARSRRTIALPDFVVDALHAHRGRQMGEKLLAADQWETSDLIFTTPFGKPLTDRVARDHFYRILDRAGLRRQRFHDLRHCCASLLIARHVEPRVVMETLGHSTIGMTMNTYAHVIKEAQREAAGRMNDLLAGT